jgi:ATP-dependent Lhr-like helicase
VKRTAAPPLRVLWITPLRALAADTLESLAAPVRDLGSVDARVAHRRHVARHARPPEQALPTALVTTPRASR